MPDGGARGLYLVIQPTGHKSWAVRYHKPGTTSTVKLTLGSVDITGKETTAEPVVGGHLTLSGARQLAAEIARQRALGRDPVAERRARARATSFPDAIRAFITEHARPKTRRWPETARTLGLEPETLEPIPGGLAERWRQRPVAEVNADDIFALVDEARKRGIPGRGRRTTGPSEARARGMAAALSSCFGWLRSNRWVPADPTEGMARPEVAVARERLLNDDEVRWFWLATSEMGEPWGALMRFLLLTGARREEAARMPRSELAGNVWTLPAARSKNRRSHALTLSGLAVAELEALTYRGEFVFSVTHGLTPANGFSKAKIRLDMEMLALARRELGEEATIEPWVTHDLRRTAASGMQRAGVDLHIIERVLNHTSGSFGGIVGTYQRHKYQVQVAEALEAWSQLVLGVVDPARNLVSLNLPSLRSA